MSKEEKEDDLPAYTNYCKLAHTPDEFFMDLATLYPSVNPENLPPGHTHGKIVGRFAMTPSQAKRLAVALSANVQQYEEQYGVIDPAPERPASIRLN